MILKNNPFYFYFFLNQLLLNTVVNAQEFKNIYSTYTDQSIELDGKDDEEFWENLPWMPGGKLIWDSIRDYNPTILTSPMDQNGHAASIIGKQKWIKRELGLDINDRVIFSHDKYEYAIRGGVIGILIDDYDKNINLFKEHGGITIHHQNEISTTLLSLEEIKNGYRSPAGNSD